MATTIKTQERLARSAAGTSSLGFDPTGRDELRLVEVLIDQIDPDPDQPRKVIGELDELTESIRTHGLVQPIVVVPVDGGRYRILAGERRYHASKAAGRTSVPCVVRSVEDQQKLELQIIENIHRKDLNPIEEAESFQRLMAQFDYSQGDLAKRVGKSKSSVNETLRLLKLDPSLMDDVRTSEQVTKSVLLEIVKESDVKRQRRLWEKAKQGQLTVRRAREAKPSKPKAAKDEPKVFRSDAGTVTVKPSKKGAGQAEVVALLESALQQAKQDE